MLAQGVTAFAEELACTREMAGQASAQWVFDDLVRSREVLFRFSAVRAVMTQSSQVKLNELFDHNVKNDFATPEYQEKLIEKALRGVLRCEGLGDRFQSTKLGVDGLQFKVPFAELDADGKALRLIKPMHLAYEDPLRTLDHGNQWLGCLRHLARVKAMPRSMLLAVTQPPLNTDRFGAFEEVRRDLEKQGAVFAASNDENALLNFAQAA